MGCSTISRPPNPLSVLFCPGSMDFFSVSQSHVESVVRHIFFKRGLSTASIVPALMFPGKAAQGRTARAHYAGIPNLANVRRQTYTAKGNKRCVSEVICPLLYLTTFHNRIFGKCDCQSYYCCRVSVLHNTWVTQQWKRKGSAGGSSVGSVWKRSFFSVRER